MTLDLFDGQPYKEFGFPSGVAEFCTKFVLALQPHPSCEGKASITNALQTPSNAPHRQFGRPRQQTRDNKCGWLEQ